MFLDYKKYTAGYYIISFILMQIFIILILVFNRTIASNIYNSEHVDHIIKNNV
jgi:uncharacterized membrane protein